MLLNVVLIAFIAHMTSSKEGCKRYFTKRNVEINGCDKTMSLDREILSVQCTEYCEKDPQCRAAISDATDKTRGCCLLYNDTVFVTGRGNGTKTLYYKPTTTVLPMKDDTGSGSFDGYTTYVGTTCKDGPVLGLEVDGIEECIEECNAWPACAGFTHFDKGECHFWQDLCQENNQEQRDDATTYVRNN